MLDSKQFDDIAKKLFSALPEGMQNFEREIERKFKEVLMAAFSKLDLVTREEFDVQTKVLARTRDKLDSLQMQVDALIKLQEIEEKEKK